VNYPDTTDHQVRRAEEAHIPAFLRQYGVAAQVGSSFGTETNPDGLRVITGHKLVT
jgi:hypothetical protein